MALPATDNFNRANGAPGANWTGSAGDDLTIVSNEVRGAGYATCSMYWSADAPNDAQYAQCKLSNSGANAAGPCVRQSATDWVSCSAIFDQTKWVLWWFNADSYTQIGSDYATSPASGDIGKITADSSTFKGYVNGTERISGSNAEAPSSGYGGLQCWSDGTYMDDFEVGNLAAAGQPTMARMFGVPTGAGRRDRPGGWNVVLRRLLPWRLQRLIGWIVGVWDPPIVGGLDGGY